MKESLKVLTLVGSTIFSPNTFGTDTLKSNSGIQATIDMTASDCKHLIREHRRSDSLHKINKSIRNSCRNILVAEVKRNEEKLRQSAIIDFQLGEFELLDLNYEKALNHFEDAVRKDSGNKDYQTKLNELKQKLSKQ